MKTPEISVVMSVYNGSEHLEATLESILNQEGCDFEFIIVNDGSTDASGSILDKYAARDGRLRVIHQENTGLTKALIRGCASARGEFIARQDAGDISLSGRLQRQAERLRKDASCIAVSCHTEFVSPRDEFLYHIALQENVLNRALLETRENLLYGPSHHGSIMMRRAAYEAVGGYRGAFYFAQDLDLWTRLAERGRFAVVPDVLLRARLEAGSISGSQTLEQRRLAAIIARMAAARRAGLDESPQLVEAATIGPMETADKSRRLARGNYFIGCCLRRRDPLKAGDYFAAALKHDRRYWKAWLRYFACSGLKRIAEWKTSMYR